jgi:CheY-like chemotaxis protein
MKVLILDGDWHFAQQASAHLESFAHLVVHHSSLEPALAQIEHWQPDLVILGAEFAEKALAAPVFDRRPRPAVLLTEHMDRYDRAWRAWQKGGDELLMKPIFTHEELHAAIVTALENATAGTRRRRVHAASA